MLDFEYLIFRIVLFRLFFLFLKFLLFAFLLWPCVHLLILCPVFIFFAFRFCFELFLQIFSRAFKDLPLILVSPLCVYTITRKNAFFKTQY